MTGEVDSAQEHRDTGRVVRDHARPHGSDAEMESLGCNLWTLRDGLIVRIDFYPTRAQGLKAAGLSE